jgi:hypothetical protein
MLSMRYTLTFEETTRTVGLSPKLISIAHRPDEAMSDPAYQTKDTLVSEKGPAWLWRWMRSLGQNLSFVEDPEVPNWVELYNK